MTFRFKLHAKVFYSTENTLELTHSHIVGIFISLSCSFFLLPFSIVFVFTFIFNLFVWTQFWVCVVERALFIVVVVALSIWYFRFIFFSPPQIIFIPFWIGEMNTALRTQLVAENSTYNKMCNPQWKTWFLKRLTSTVYPLSSSAFATKNSFDIVDLPIIPGTEWTARGADICIISIKLQEL